MSKSVFSLQFSDGSAHEKPKAFRAPRQSANGNLQTDRGFASTSGEGVASSFAAIFRTPSKQSRNYAARRAHNSGFTVLIAIVVASIVLAIALSIMSITLKQLTLAGIARESEIAFQAANAGVERIRFYDISDFVGDKFDVPGNGTEQASAAIITCLTEHSVQNNNGPAASGDEQHFQWTWDDGRICTDVSVYKFYSESGDEDLSSVGITSRDCIQGVECTIIKARGYNAPCNAIASDRVVERELTVVY